MWTSFVNEWFDKGYIARAEILSEREILIVPGPVENFGFHFHRNLIPIGNLQYRSDGANYIVNYTDWNALLPDDQEAFNAFRQNAHD